MKEHYKTPEELSEVTIGNLPKKEFRVTIVEVIKELKRRMNVQSKKVEVFKKELENIKNRDEDYNN